MDASNAESRGEMTKKNSSIQVLRGVAVLLVLLFHLGIFDAGFIGVDIFFVISGYLIAKSALGREFRGLKQAIAFIRRRVARLLPAFATMATLVSVAAIPVLNPKVHVETLTTAVAGFMLAANIPVSIQLGDYFGGSKESYPLMHTWSLSVEEQLYAAFILSALLASWLWPRRLRLLVGLVWLGAGAVSILLFSIGPYLAGFPMAGIVSYFSPVTRLWQFGLGVGVFFLTAWRQATHQTTSSSRKESIKWLTLVSLALLAALAFPLIGLPFGSLWVVSASLLSAVFLAFAILNEAQIDIRPLHWLGDRSYSIYLWHWPVISLYLTSNDKSALENLFEIALIVFVSLLLGHLSFRLVETPWLGLSNRPSSKKNRVNSKSSFALLLIVPIALVLSNSATQVKDQAVQEIFYSKVSLDTCHGRSANQICSTQTGGAGPRLVLIGDSHARMFTPAVTTASTRLPISELLVRTAPGCSGIAWTEETPGSISNLDSCARFYEEVLFLVNSSIETVFLVATASLRASPDSLILFSDLAASKGHTTIFIEPIPQFDDAWSLKQCSFTSTISRTCGPAGFTTASESDTPLQPGALALEISGVQVDDLVCRNQVCSIWDQDGLLIYEDSGHLEPSWLLQFSEEIAGRIREVL